MSPYIVTTKRPEGYYRDLPPKIVSRRAVASLGEARAAAIMAAKAGGADPMDYRHSLPYEQASALSAHTGGTVGPLPDGTVVEVASRTWEELANDERAEGWPDEMDPDAGWAEAHRRIIDAFNARQL